jgi:hypothetical protein
VCKTESRRSSPTTVVAKRCFDGLTLPPILTRRRSARSFGSSVHDAIESECLYPLVEHRLADGNRLTRETLGEHVEMAQMLAEIDGRRAGDPRRRALLADLADVSRSHFAAEETTLLAPLHRRLAPEELALLKRAVRTARRKAPTRPHPRAPRFAVGTHLAAATLHPVDRLRDALRRRP